MVWRAKIGGENHPAFNKMFKIFNNVQQIFLVNFACFQEVKIGFWGGQKLSVSETEFIKDLKALVDLFSYLIFLITKDVKLLKFVQMQS